MENISLKNIISPNKKPSENYINVMAHKILIDKVIPCFTVIQIPSSDTQKLYKLYPASKKQTLLLAAVKRANSLKPLEKPYPYVFCQIV